MTVAVRFAPSPTGRLHVGNARVALVNWLFARKHGGRFVLRFDDTDLARSEARHADSIETDLRWLGLTWDETVWQSRRTRHYRAAFEKLRAAGRVYPCYETAEELKRARKRRMARGRPPVYDRAALELTDADREALEREGRRAYWRFRLEDVAVGWNDLVHGPLEVESTSLSDPVILRADGTPLYVFTSVVDDIGLGITHIIRGDDHIANSAAQLQLFGALAAAGEGAAPALAHLPLLTDARGGSLSKRLGSLSLERLRAEGVEPMAVNSLLAKLGTSDPVEPRRGLDELVAEFDLARFGRAGAKFDVAELWRLNARLLHETPFARVRDRLEALGLDGVDEAFWNAVRPNLTRLEDAREWWAVCHGPVTPVILDRELTSEAAGLLPDGPLGDDTWETWTRAVAAATGRRGRRLFRPLRLALTGRERGPELKTLLPLIGRDRAAARLNGKTA